MDYFGYDSGNESGLAGGGYPLHDLAERGDLAALVTLLSKAAEAEDQEFNPENASEAAGADIDLNERDDDNCTPLHVALLRGHVACVHALLEAGAEQLDCEGSRPLHLAVSRGAFSGSEGVVNDMIKLLVDNGADPYDLDDGGRTALHLAASLGLTDTIELLLSEGDRARAAAQDARRRLEEARLAAEADPTAGVGLPDPEELGVPEPLVLAQDSQGQTALHLAARFGKVAAVGALLARCGANPEEAALPRARTKGGQTALHLAAFRGCTGSAALIKAACPALAEEKDRRGHVPSDIAALRGFEAVLSAVGGGAAAAPAAGGSAANAASVKTFVIAPPACLDHHTCPEPITRSSDEVPPENSNRLRVLTEPDWGILRTAEFSGLTWDEDSQPVAVADLLRVHEWTYVRRIQQACQALPDNPLAIGHLDGDTAVSHRTYRASMAAAGAVTRAVDWIMTGDARNAFCAVRPPGHHAGPTGVVTSLKDPLGSHGFCLFNNVAVGAAYALHVYRHQGIRRVAILDFDVHHGNGTQACVGSVVPTQQRFSFKTPMSEGVQTFQVWRPWLDTADRDNIFFASCQGYGPKAPGIESFVYPGSGATCDTRPGAAAAPPADRVDEDPNGEFPYTGGEAPPEEGPRVVNVGIEKRTPDANLWRRAWRDKILPALVNFAPDFIFLSAGFDAHRKDEINFGYLGIQEKEYEWLTDQVVQIANRHCGGRVVSVLEGGYRIQGGVVSAFARSVAAHVRALAEPHTQRYDACDARFEREYERRRRAEQEAKRRAAMAGEALMGEAKPEEAVWGEGHNERPLVLRIFRSQPPQASLDGAPPGGAAAAAAAAAPGSDGGDEGRESKRRRRGNVDYVALNKKLEEEERKKAGGSAPQ